MRIKETSCFEFIFRCMDAHREILTINAWIQQQNYDYKLYMSFKGLRFVAKRTKICVNFELDKSECKSL